MMITWVDQVQTRAQILHNEIAAWRTHANALGIDPDIACAPFYAMLNELYAEDMPLARAKDSSELLLHIEGSAVNINPSLSLISSIFNNVKSQVRDLTKVLLGLGGSKKLKDIDLGLSGIAQGSLYIGFNVPPPREMLGNENLLSREDTLFKATRSALNLINTASHSIDKVLDDDEAGRKVAADITDPMVRDAALVALQRIAPTGRRGVDSIGVASGAETRPPAELTPNTRTQINRMLLRPVASRESMEFVGVIRSIDLDARRFDLRGIADEQIHDIRCIYGDMNAADARRWLDAQVRVRGLVERRADKAPRLMSVESIELSSRWNIPDDGWRSVMLPWFEREQRPGDEDDLPPPQLLLPKP